MLVACGGGGGGGDSGGGGGSSGTGNLTVRVLDDQSNPVASSTVTVTAGGSSRSATTEPDGNAAFTGLPAGSASVEATKTNYISGSASASVPNGGTNTVTARITRRTGSIAVTVLDAFDTPVPNAAAQVTADGRALAGTTPSSGTVTVAAVPTGAASVSVTANGFLAAAAQSVTVNEGQTTALTVRLQRLTQAAGGFVTARVETGGLSADGRTLSFNIQVIVIDDQGRAVENPDLTAAAFTLQPCTDSTTTAFECVRGSQQSNDASYEASTPSPTGLVKVDGQSRVPFLASLLLDQSRSVGQQSDPTDARIFATKTFLDKPGIAGDAYGLSAFASDADAGQGGPALIPTKPVTNYGTSTNGRSFFDELDALANLEGGATPLYEALDTAIADARATPSAGDRAVVLFTDGKDTTCTPAVTCRLNSIALANQSPAVNVFTIGLSNDIDFEAMAELADGTQGYFLFAESAPQLIPIYGSLGALLSKSLSSYQMVWQIQADRTGAFQPGRTVLGRLEITAGTSTVELPFIVRIPVT